MTDIIHARLIQMPNGVVWQAYNRVLHPLGHLASLVSISETVNCDERVTHLAKSFCLSMFLEAESREMDTRSENLGLCQDTDSSNAIDLHFHVWVAEWIAEIRQVRSPCSILGVTFDDNSILIKRIGERQGRLRLLPRVQIIGLLSTKPVRQRPPNVWNGLVSRNFAQSHGDD